MAKAELGIKRVCLSCNMHFYDFDRSPIVALAAASNSTLSVLQKAKKAREHPKPRQK